MNRLTYDCCAYSKALSESVAPLDYMMDTSKYEHCNKCRIELGVVGGTAVSHVSGNLVDLENNLLGLDRPNTKCPSYKFLPPAPGQPLQGKEYITPVQHAPIDTNLRHLPACQMHDFPGVPAPPPMRPFVCGGPEAAKPAPTSGPTPLASLYASHCAPF